MNKIEIVKASLSDLKKIILIDKEASLYPWPDIFFIEELKNKNSYTYLANYYDEDNKLSIGYLIFRLLFDSIDVINIAVLPKFRRKGVATLLMEKMFSLGVEKSVKSIYLEVRESNKGAIELYEKIGFKKSYIRRNYYANSENALVMLKEVKYADI